MNRCFVLDTVMRSFSRLDAKVRRPLSVSQNVSKVEQTLIRDNPFTAGNKEIYFQHYGRFNIDKIWRDDILPCRLYLRHW